MMDAEPKDRSAEALWCVNVQGPDDIYAAPNRDAAQSRADALNVEFSKFFEQHQCDPTDAILKAVVIEWPRSAESHARDLQVAGIISEPKDHTMNIREAARILTDASYGGSKASGWHNDIKTGLPRTDEQNHDLFPTRIALCHSELSEALEGHRKGLMDDKLSHRPMAEVELADTVIRVFDLAGAMGYDLGAAIEEKLAYNQKRADHKPENRQKAGGKAY